MNEQIMQAARALAQLLADSREHQLVQRMEQEALADEALQGEYRTMMQLRQQMQELAMASEPDSEKLAELSQDMERMQGVIQDVASMQRLSEAREAFSSLMEMVNYEIQLVLNPDLVEESPGCGSGGCAGCQGCCGR